MTNKNQIGTHDNLYKIVYVKNPENNVVFATTQEQLQTHLSLGFVEISVEEAEASMAKQ